MQKKLAATFGHTITSEIINGAAAAAVNGSNSSIPKADDNEEFHFVTRNKLGSTRQFLRALKPFVLLGRCFGIISRGDVLSQKDTKINVSISTIVSACLTIFLLMNAVLMIRLNIRQYQRDKAEPVKSEGFCQSGYACVMFLVYAYQLLATVRFRNIIQKFVKTIEWSHLSNHHGPETKWFSRFPHACAVMVVLSILCGIAENIVHDIQLLGVRTFGIPWNTSQLKLYYMLAVKHWDDALPSPVTILFVILIKLCTCGWIYADTISMVLCRALWEKLRIMDQSLAADLKTVKNSSTKGKNQKAHYYHDEIFIAGKNSKILPSSKVISRNLDDYHDEYLEVANLVQQVQDYISPLMVANYTCNVYMMIVILFQWIGPVARPNGQFQQQQQQSQMSLHTWFALFHFGFRIAVVTYMAAEVHQMNVSLRERIQTCPNDEYSLAVERLERALQTNPSGVRLFGAFMITRHYFISIIGLIFTAEIVLLLAYVGYVPPFQG